MNKKYLGIIAVVILLAIMVIMDRQKIEREKKPPLPTVMVGNQSIPPLYESFSWNNGNKYKALEIQENLERTLVEPFHDLMVTFPEGESPDSYIIRAIEEMAFHRAYLPTFTDESAMKLPTYPGNITLMIEAYWPEGEASYKIPIKMEEKWSYQPWLSPTTDSYRLVMIGEELFFPPHVQHILNGMEPVFGELEDLRTQYPEIDIKSLPTFLLFDEKSIVYRTEDSEELMNYLNSKAGSRYIHWLSGDPDKLSVFLILSDNKIMTEMIQTLISIEYVEYVSNVQGSSYTVDLMNFYPELPFDKMPIFFVFDHKDLLYYTQDSNEVYEFIESWKP